MSVAAFRRVGPGLALLGALGVGARMVGAATPLDPLVVAVAGGVLFAATVGVPAVAEAGTDRYPLLLETGIVLLGAQMTLGRLVSTGPVVIALAVGVIVVGIAVVESLGRVAGVGGDTRSLLAAGASVCGVSAVMAVAGSIDGDEDAVAYAAGTVLLFDAITLVAFPIVAAGTALPDRAIGVWAGLSLFSTGPAAAAGFAVSATAGQWATVAKLVRNAFIGVVAVGYAVTRATAGERTDLRAVWTRFPKFLLGFVLVALLANAGILDAGARAVLDGVVGWLFTLAFVGLGIELDPRKLRATGVRPMAVVLVQFLLVSGLVLAAVTVLL